MFKFLDPFEKFKKCLEKNKLEEAIALIIANSSITKNPYFIHCCAHSKNLEIIKLGLSFKPNYITQDDRGLNPLHFLASLKKFNIDEGYGSYFFYTPDDYKPSNKRTKKEAMKIHFNSSFNPKILKLLDRKKKYIHEVTPDMTLLAPIDISFTDLDVDGVKSFLDHGTSLNKLIKKKMNYHKSIVKESWAGQEISVHKSMLKIADQYYYMMLFGTFEETTLKDWDKITSIARLMKKKGYKFDEKKLTKFQETNDSEYKKKLKVFKSLIK
jgi:hypothetical protein